MKRLVYSILFLALAVAAQQAAKTPAIDRPSQPNFVFDDDGGAVQIVPADLALSGPKKFHGGEVLKSVQQGSIFLGSGWGDDNVRVRQTALFDVLAMHRPQNCKPTGSNHCLRSPSRKTSAK